MEHQFDDLAKALAEDVSRREALRRVGSVLAGALLAATGLGSAWGQGRGGGGGGGGCPSGQTKCKGKCVNLQTDSQNCGSCRNACGSGQVCCSGTCIPLGTHQDCSFCGDTCTGGTSCVNGSCQCPNTQSNCNGNCVDTASNVNNCGTCGTACTGSQICSSGSCCVPSGSLVPWLPELCCHGACEPNYTAGTCTCY